MKKYKYTTNIKKLDKRVLAEGMHKIISDAWGSWGVDYVENHVLTSKYVALAYDGQELIGFASAKLYDNNGEAVYYLEFTAISPKHQGQKLSIKLNRMIFKEIIIDNILKFKGSFKTVAISPNPRILGEIIRTASYVFPNPHDDNGKSPDHVWKVSNFILDKIGDPYNSFDRNNNVLQGFYDETPDLIYSEKNYPKDKDPEVNKFAVENLKFKDKKGREFVIYAKYNLTDFIKRIFT